MAVVNYFLKLDGMDPGIAKVVFVGDAFTVMVENLSKLQLSLIDDILISGVGPAVAPAILLVELVAMFVLPAEGDLQHRV